MFSPWRSEYYWLIWLTLVAGLVGKLTGLYMLTLLACVLVYLLHHLANINQILIWLRSGGKIPTGSGVWEEIYYLVYRIRRRNKTRKKRLLRMLERFRTATAALPDATVVLGPRDEIEWFNEASSKLLGFRKTDVGRQIANLIRYPKFVEFLKAANYTETMCLPSPISERLQLDIRVVPYGDELRLLIARDVTQLRFMEKVRTDFVANVSHELRTPLTVLKGYVETLDTIDDGASARHKIMFKRMREQTERMHSLIDGLLSLTRLEAANTMPHVPVDVPSLLRTICEEYAIVADTHADLELSIESDAGLIGSEAELRSVFSNLIGNALKYTPSSGHIKIRWKEETDKLVAEVEDNGPGIAPEHLERLTERFYRVEPEEGPHPSGAGLGLAIVKHALSRHDGELKIHSTLGKGSCFSCCFPAKRSVHDLH
jgi:two-component system phosphate regulon sensor histidine kinase PhoR